MSLEALDRQWCLFDSPVLLKVKYAQEEGQRYGRLTKRHYTWGSFSVFHSFPTFGF